MADVTLEEVLQMAARLSPEDRMLLIKRLAADEFLDVSVAATHEGIQAEHARHVASGAFEHVESLRGRYAKTGDFPSDEELEASIKASATEWEQELDGPEFFGMWSDRTDIEDSETFARRLRDKGWTRDSS